MTALLETARQTCYAGLSHCSEKIFRDPTPASAWSRQCMGNRFAAAASPTKSSPPTNQGSLQIPTELVLNSHPQFLPLPHQLHFRARVTLCIQERSLHMWPQSLIRVIDLRAPSGTFPTSLGCVLTAVHWNIPQASVGGGLLASSPPASCQSLGH
jgi:hypothetical protein